MEHIFKAVRDIVEDIEDVVVVFPLHMNPEVKTIIRLFRKSSKDRAY